MVMIDHCPESHCVRDDLFDLRGERYARRRAARDLDAVESAIGVDHDRASVGRPCAARIDAGPCEALLIVVRESVPHRPLAARSDIVGMQHRLFTDPADERQQGSIRRERRASAAACAIGDRRDASGVAIVTAELPDAGVHVAVIGIALRAAGEIHITAVT